MPGKVHIPKLTRTACGKKLTDKIKLASRLMDMGIQYPSCCVACTFSEFLGAWSMQVVHDRIKYRQRFGGFPDNSVIEPISHKKTIEAYQEKGFNV